MPQSNELITVAQAAEILNLSPRAVRHRALAGTIPSQKLPMKTGAYVFNRADIEALRKTSAA